MTNEEMRKIKEELGIIDYKINYKTGVHLGIVEDFFAGKTDTLDSKDRKRIEDLLAKEAKKK